MGDWAPLFIDIVRAHAGWAWPVVFLVAFCESLAVLSLLVPGFAILIALSALIPTGALEAWPLITSATAGAVAGDAVSYWVGRYCRGLPSRWPLRRHADAIGLAMAYFRRHGGKSVFIGRFSGPLRAFVPLVAGMSEMAPGRFWAANILSALVWAPSLVLAGDVLGRVFDRLLRWPPELLASLAALTLVAAALLLRRRPRDQNLTP
jgi:membrane protein DedA with SNARE-associated domain